MAFKLTKANLASRETLVRQLRAKAVILSAAITTQQDASTVYHYLAEYNNILKNCRLFVASIVARFEAEFHAQPMTWLWSRRWVAARTLINEWHDIDLTDVLLTGETTDVRLPQADDLENLPTGL